MGACRKTGGCGSGGRNGQIRLKCPAVSQSVPQVSREVSRDVPVTGRSPAVGDRPTRRPPAGHHGRTGKVHTTLRLVMRGSTCALTTYGRVSSMARRKSVTSRPSQHHEANTSDTVPCAALRIPPKFDEARAASPDPMRSADAEPGAFPVCPDLQEHLLETIQRTVQLMHDAMRATILTFAAAAADRITKAMVRDLNDGVLPSPAADAPLVCDALYARALAAAGACPFMDDYEEGALALLMLRFAREDAFAWPTYNAFALLAGDLRDHHAVTRVPLRGVNAGIDELSWDQVQWQQIAHVLVRDLILTNIADDKEAVELLGVRYTTNPSVHQVPVWIHMDPMPPCRTAKVGRTTKTRQRQMQNT